MPSDYLSELLGGDDNSDRDIGDALAQNREAMERLAAGDFSDVAPWSTVEETIRDVNERETILSARLAGGTP